MSKQSYHSNSTSTLDSPMAKYANEASLHHLFPKDDPKEIFFSLSIIWLTLLTPFYLNSLRAIPTTDLPSKVQARPNIESTITLRLHSPTNKDQPTEKSQTKANTRNQDLNTLPQEKENTNQITKEASQAALTNDNRREQTPQLNIEAIRTKSIEALSTPQEPIQDTKTSNKKSGSVVFNPSLKNELKTQAERNQRLKPNAKGEIASFVNIHQEKIVDTSGCQFRVEQSQHLDMENWYVVNCDKPSDITIELEKIKKPSFAAQ